MRDDWMGGLLAFGVAAPVMVVCCGGGGVILAATLGGIGGWLTGLGGIAAVTAALGGLLFWREIRRVRARQTNENVEKEDFCASPSVRTAKHRDPVKAN